ncbi:MAG: phosphoglycerate kinase [Candidatus Yanofskybacteria bacterium RIFCSPHIGHO2_01_FULL_45_42]|uniref:Phosphoglycerate kinase n=3 Tax=Candidatus Yanofskyibacteriota TaxID=1752733 RepID=A0A1F8F861_9BACT|nr:MAG: phosphoglycerate kinase [Candidatus Yanofskybacteria bacterium RIFCSPHIGHO2_01_FULL_45_42]OGN15563.1 MAG: phosphoglycerate kinase [Candidatus Yanofskybacteria bacterium RIFCSPHIGHO2_02_FULL_46_19]OGN27261.1 MAG: phosphoglycerate kinase [Candidatus Yanofskybacteria bacterium RIFCSPLOWO2_01_FULL_45_72]OGN32199.1 MAG: phosphoglycerate kinase [Candidatus Yanofskybacteria bacterium RIFCSPLOWO2_02_FULL_45_18]
MKTVKDIPNLKDKKVLLRVDFDMALNQQLTINNQPSSSVSHGARIAEPFRVEKQKLMIDYLIEHDAKVVMVAHLGDTGEFAPLIPQLHMLLGREIAFLKSIEEIPAYLENYAGPALLENIRRFPGEKENDEELAQKLSSGLDIYINNAFAVCHRKHASVSAVTKFLPSYAGFLVEEEIAKLGQAIDAPAEEKVIIMGGVKAETKAPVIKNLIDNADKILLSGVIANDIAKARGEDIGRSVVDDNINKILSNLDIASPKLVLPVDYIMAENRRLDIGEKTIAMYREVINSAKTIIWNGPMGVFEKDEFSAGTKLVAQAVADSSAIKIIGGGDTIAAVNRFSIPLEKFTFVSTGGGAMLAFLAGERLSGLEALGYYADK